MQFPGKDAPSTVITFAQKTVKDGALLSKLHVIELGGAGGVEYGIRTILPVFISCQFI